MSFPRELLEREIWVDWRLTPDKDGGKDRKVPFNPKTGKAAKSNDPASWGTYDQAVEARDHYGYTGIGFMFWPDADIVGVDIDHCYDPETGQFNETAQAVMAKQPTYIEFSPSGTGVHLLFKGKKPNGACKNQELGIEMYDSGRYFTVTEKQAPGSLDTIAEDDGTLAWIHDTYIRKKKDGGGKKTRKKARSSSEPLTDEEVLEKARGAGDDGLFADLYDGKWEGRYGSQSEADMALCMKLAFWTAKDAAQIDRLFRQSKLMRDKWDQPHRSDGTTYGQETVAKAVEMTETVYTPGSSDSVFEYAGGYFRVKGDGVIRLTNFVVEPRDMIRTDDETQLTADLVAPEGTFRKDWMTTDFNSAQKFKGMLNKSTISLAYFGGDSDLEQLKVFLAGLDWTYKEGVNATGIYRHEGQLVFVCGDTAMDKSGEPVTDIVQMERWKEIESEILATDPLTKEKLMTIGRSILSYNEPAKTVPILAWAAGCFVKEHLRMKRIKYPLLFLIGEAGSGKSTTMEKVLLPIFCVTRVSAASQMTRFTLMKMAASSNVLPLFLDEFKPSKMDRQRLNQLYNHFRDTYDGHRGERGSIDLSVKGFDLLAPMVVAGEEAADETAVRERSVELLFSKRDLKNQAYRDSFLRITKMESLLGDLGRSLLQTALGTDPDTVARWHEEMADRFDNAMPERVRTNLCGAYCGLKLLEALCQKLDVAWGEVFPFALEQCVGYLEASAKEYLLDGGTHNKSVVDETFEIMSRMNLSPKEDYCLSDDGTLLYLRFPKIYDDYTRYRKDYAIQGEVLTYTEFKRQLKHSDLYVDSNYQRRMGEKNQKVWVVRFDLLSSRSDVSGFIADDVKPLT